MKKYLTFLFLLCILHNLSAQMGVEDKRNAFNNRRFYARTARMPQNAVLLQVAQLPMNLRGTYERRLNRQFIAGANASVRFAGKEAGTLKAEIFAKMFFQKRAPQGLYLYAEGGLASVKNHPVTYDRDLSGISRDSVGALLLANALVKDFSFDFLSGCAGAGIGFQNAFGEGRRTAIDFGFGYRYYSMPSSLEKHSSEGARFIRPNYNNNILSTIFPFTFRLGIGYMF